MYEQHPVFLKPDSPDAMVWRYLDFPRFLSMLHSSALHFVRGDQFEDPYEGMLTDSMANNIRSSSEKHLHMFHQHRVNTRFDTYISCWHLSDSESAAMWKLYGPGIAVQSTFASLIDSMSNETESIFIGRVRYGDEHLRGATMPNGLSLWLTKRKSFEHERELRAIIWRPRNSGIGTMVKNGKNWEVTGFPIANADTPPGITVDVKLDALVHQIVLSPYMPNWMVEVLEGVVGKYGFSFPIHRSRLYELSLFDT